ncbi:conserved hypothetical protein [Treponema phagedenis]|uniref:AAA+ ATPase domain-containing protein n=1 Tax=Treponema phagedenis TaxID=162 RepID=A0A0B7GW49_TREPH|nr:ATP-binding protein [Treponema phagedenis]CEM61195.1 conserved hypothetical protein [Treponema phagedenis]
MRVLKQGKWQQVNITQSFLPDYLRQSKALCKTHGEYKCLIDTRTNEASPCPLCEQDRERAELETQKELEQFEARLKKIDGLPKRYRNAGFKNFVVDEKNKTARDSVLSFAKNPNNKWLLLLGKNGTGKTHLAHAVLKLTGGIFRDFDDVSTDLLDAQAGYGAGLNKTLDKYANAPMLVIDEIDKVKNTEGRITWLNTILRRRYNEMLPVVLVGNIDLERLCQIIDLHGGEAMRDRIKELGIVVNFNFESYRPVLRGEIKHEH